MSLLNSFVKMSVRMASAGFIATEATIKTAQSLIERVGGVSRDTEVLAPVNGARDLDHALSELANRTIRIAYFTPRDPAALPSAFQNWLRAVNSSFQFMDWKDPRNLLMPVTLPLSMGTLLTSAGLRGMAALEVIGAPRYIEFLKYSMQIFSEFPVYVRLEYRELIERQQDWLNDHPDDAVTRMDVGRALVKVGRFEEAARDLETAAAANSAIRSTAMHEAGLAYYLSGKFAEAVSAGCAALKADPDNAPARLWVWLAAQRLGGYPVTVPPECRMEVKVGREKPTVTYEEVSARIGLDKTAGGRGIAVFDYDNDGLLDVVIAAAHAGISLYHNNGDGTFTDVRVD